MCPPPEKVNTKGAQKKPMLMEETKDQQSMICLTEYVDALHSVQNTNSSVKRNTSSSDLPIQEGPC